MNKDSKCTIGIIGAGRFGMLVAVLLSKLFDVMVCDQNPNKRKKLPPVVSWGTLEEVLERQVLILAVPLFIFRGRKIMKAFEPLVKQIAEKVKPGTLVIDVCSLKIVPIQAMLDFFQPGVEILGVHSLWGPDAVRKHGLSGQRINVCPVRISVTRLRQVRRVLKGFKLVIKGYGPKVHDRMMVPVQVIPQFIGLGLQGVIRRSQLATETFKHLNYVQEAVGHDTPALHATVQVGNPYASEARKKYIAKLQKIDAHYDRLSLQLERAARGGKKERTRRAAVEEDISEAQSEITIVPAFAGKKKELAPIRRERVN